jgi:hypothetical protein
MFEIENNVHIKLFYYTQNPQRTFVVLYLYLKEDYIEFLLFF